MLNCLYSNDRKTVMKAFPNIINTEVAHIQNQDTSSATKIFYISIINHEVRKERRFLKFRIAFKCIITP